MKINLLKLAAFIFVSSILLLNISCDGFGSKNGEAKQNPLDTDGDGITDKCGNSVLLSWLAPTKNTDGSDLTTLAGYTIHYGTAADSMTSSIDVNDPTILKMFIGLDTDKIYYFAMQAYTTDSLTSAYTRTVSIHLKTCLTKSATELVELKL